MNFFIRKTSLALIFFLSISFVVPFLNTTNANASTLTSSDKLYDMSIPEILDYARNEGLDFEVTDASAIDKDELINMVLMLQSIPEDLVLREGKELTLVSDTITEVPSISRNSIAPLSYPDYFEYNVVRKKTYTTYFMSQGSRYTVSLTIGLRYDRYVDSGYFFTKFHQITHSFKQGSTGMNANNYVPLDQWIHSSTQTTANVRGYGKHSFTLIGINFSQDIDWEVDFLP